MGTKKANWINGISTFIEVAALSSKLLQEMRRQTRTIGTHAERVVHDFRNDAADRVEALRTATAKRLRTETYPSKKALAVLTGVGIGVCAGVLLAPRSGKETREKLFGLANHRLGRDTAMSAD